MCSQQGYSCYVNMGTIKLRRLNFLCASEIPTSSPVDQLDLQMNPFLKSSVWTMTIDCRLLADRFKISWISTDTHIDLHLQKQNTHSHAKMEKGNVKDAWIRSLTSSVLVDPSLSSLSESITARPFFFSDILRHLLANRSSKICQKPKFLCFRCCFSSVHSAWVDSDDRQMLAVTNGTCTSITCAYNYW